MKNIFLLISLLFVSAFYFSCQNTTSSKYQCPMKCEGEKIYDKPGTCPVCKMDLEKMDKKTAEGTINNSASKVTIIGAMKNVMHKGELFATINLDTIRNKQHLYGIGPVEYLTGEILILDGKAYKAEAATDTSVKMTETFNLKAPFFGYANIESWNEKTIPDSVSTIKQLEDYLDKATKDYPRPYFFKLDATVDNATVHIVNLPAGTKVSSPEDARQGSRKYTVANKKVEMLGFFSTEHKSIFTHHDTFVHIHLITDDKTKMGHLDELKITKGTAKLYLPKQ